MGRIWRSSIIGPIRPCVRPLARPPVRASVRPCVRHSVRPCVRPPVRPSVRSFVRPPVRSSVLPSVLRPSMLPSSRPSVAVWANEVARALAPSIAKTASYRPNLRGELRLFYSHQILHVPQRLSKCDSAGLTRNRSPHQQKSASVRLTYCACGNIIVELLGS